MKLNFLVWDYTGHSCTMRVIPADDDHGYKFQRRDLEGEPIIEASTSNVISTQRSTTLCKDGAEVHTTEHILAALYASGIDNALISLDGPEIPIMDGSAKLFLDCLLYTSPSPRDGLLSRMPSSA